LRLHFSVVDLLHPADVHAPGSGDTLSAQLVGAAQRAWCLPGVGPRFVRDHIGGGPMHRPHLAGAAQEEVCDRASCPQRDFDADRPASYLRMSTTAEN
jgi:hypothetical protein